MHIILPPLHKLRTIVDRLRPMSEILSIQASNNGRLHLSIHTDSVKLDTQWTNCTNPSATNVIDDDQETPDHPDKLFIVLVSIRSFLKFLNSHVVSTTTIACELALF